MITLGLAGLCLGTVAAMVGGTAAGVIPWPVAVIVSSVACFAGFTPVHEAAHYNVSRYHPLNELTGHLCALLVLGALLPYRFLHHEHHRHTNHPERDPDHWCGRARGLAVPLRWASQDVGYVLFYFRRWSSRPARERAHLLGCGALYAGVTLAAAWAGPHVLLAVVAGWLLPAKLAMTVLAATFAWLPHAPHTSTDRYRATTVRSSPLLNVLLLGQSYHLVHHLQPGVPFYRLAATWRARREELLALGAVDLSAEAGHGVRGCDQRSSCLR
jgi:beta-carotene hydroxylase